MKKIVFDTFVEIGEDFNNKAIIDIITIKNLKVIIGKRNSLPNQRKTKENRERKRTRAKRRNSL